MNDLEKLWHINEGFRLRFPDSNSPWQMLARILEEGGELAQQVAHFEDSGIKRQKYGEPDWHKLATEVKGVLIAALQIAQHYGIQEELSQSIERTYQGLKREGFITAEKG
jgi:NTP pyrophosphatase (non-canonical NTP hydrolase)